MAKEGRSIYRTVWKNFINSLKPRRFRGDLVGTDHLGNQYFEIPKGGPSNQRRARWYVTKGGDEDKFDEALPAEWESWLRYRRKEPPTEEEIRANMKLMEYKKIKAAEIEAKHQRPTQDFIEPSGKVEFPKYEGYELYPGKKPGEKT